MPLVAYTKDSAMEADMNKKIYIIFIVLLSTSFVIDRFLNASVEDGISDLEMVLSPVPFLIDIVAVFVLIFAIKKK